ncbi:MAG: kelch repeat-containing protein [Flavobacteriales bacterium]
MNTAFRSVCFACGMTLTSFTVHAQNGQWTWIKGSSVPNQSAVWGTMGVAAPGNTPPSLLQPYFWTAIDGTFWLYGGRDGNGQGYAALWKYDPATNQWTWMKGPTTTNGEGNFGTQGVPGALNEPPAKSFGATAWTDLDGNFWMYGGVNGDSFDPPPNNDLWKYEVATNTWTWMKGSASQNPPPVWGIKGVPDINNQPPAHSDCHATWTDDLGDLWMFGGFNRVDGFGAQYNATWRYNIPTNTWTWMAGDSVGNTPAVYGTLGIPAAANTPDGRYARSLAKAADGSFWMYGGTAGGNWVYNDPWRFDPITAYWTWMGGSQVAQQPAVFGTQCETTATNDPGRRVGINWQGTDGRWWIFGNNTEGSSHMSSNDMWTFCPTIAEWTWATGPNTINDVGNWGAIGVASPTNRPNGRNFSATWTAANGDLYLFGGLNDVGVFTVYNDLWKFTPDAACGTCGGTMGLDDVVIDPGAFTVTPNPSSVAKQGNYLYALDASTWAEGPFVLRATDAQGNSTSTRFIVAHLFLQYSTRHV